MWQMPAFSGLEPSSPWLCPRSDASQLEHACNIHFEMKKVLI